VRGQHPSCFRRARIISSGRRTGSLFIFLRARYSNREPAQAFVLHQARQTPADHEFLAAGLVGGGYASSTSHAEEVLQELIEARLLVNGAVSSLEQQALPDDFPLQSLVQPD
jgi:hypothetical protein